MPPVASASRPALLKAVADRINRLFAQGHLDGAEVLLTTLSGEPGMAAYLAHMRGLIAWRRGDNAQARQQLAATISLEPTNAEAHANLGALLIEAGHRAAAVAAYEAALTLRPRRPAALVGLGKALAELGLFDLAIDAYRDVLAAEPDHPSATADLAALLDDTSTTTSRQQRIERPLGDDDRRVLCDALFVQGVRHHRDNAVDRSITSFDCVLTLDPDHVNTLCNLGALERDRGHHDRALGLLRHAVGLAPEFVAARLALGDTLLVSGRADEAIAQFREALDRAPLNDAVHASLALGFRATGDFGAAISHFEQAVLINRQQSAEFYLALGQTLIATNQLPGAAICLQHAFDLDPALLPAREALQLIDPLIVVATGGVAATAQPAA
ncbi:MAG TPA: tetratricopeptide repeat protein [Rhodopseudomonas sp.]|uniref:tetratricopeptide repeat protein n=1 Tax=Rhodopseudomonas sp. TaxID=1078 RepID=UPI002EDBA666